MAASSSDPTLRELGQRWQQFLRPQVRWKMACERTIFFAPGEAEQSSVFSNAELFEAAVRETCRRQLQRPAAAGRHGPARPSARHHTPGRRPELPLRSGHGRRSAASTTASCSAASPISYRICRDLRRRPPTTTPSWPRPWTGSPASAADDVTNM